LTPFEHLCKHFRQAAGETQRGDVRTNAMMGTGHYTERFATARFAAAFSRLGVSGGYKKSGVRKLNKFHSLRRQSIPFALHPPPSIDGTVSTVVYRYVR
jgi:hypothetical protein